MDSHQVIVAPLADDRTLLYDVAITAGNRSKHQLFGTLESALESFCPPLSARVRSHIVEGVRGEAKPVVFCLEDSFEEQ